MIRRCADPPGQVTVEGRELRLEDSLEGAPHASSFPQRRLRFQSRVYLPAEDETYCATAWIWAGLSFPWKAGIMPPPTIT